ncbi:MAG TPA: ATP-binding protein [Blastocatellia bacterium]|nr:ATP-binding protein [Blastocatellia bacterium]
MREIRRLSAEDVYAACDPTVFDFETTASLPPPAGFIGQKRAVSAIRFGLNIESRGYNLFLTGPPGTGKTSLIRAMLDDLARQRPVPGDVCLVNNFRDPDRPRALHLPAGMGRQLKRDMDGFIARLREEIPKALQSKEYEDQQAEIVRRYQESSAALFAQLEQRASREGIQFRITPTGIVTRPLVNGKPISQEEYDALPETVREALRRRLQEFNEEIARLLDDVRALERQARERAEELERLTLLFIVRQFADELKRRYSDYPEVLDYLDQVQESVLENREVFKRKPEAEPTPGLRVEETSPFVPYQVNVLVDNSDTQGAPIVFEPNPTYTNMFGAIEREARFGALVTDFTKIKAGSILRANGGFLVVEALDVLKYPFVWDSLKRVVESGELRIEDVATQYGLVSTTGLRPEPIAVDVKIVLIGSPLLHLLLYTFDEDFRKLFKVKADFDTQMDRTPENLLQYAYFIKSCCDREGLAHFDRDAVAAIIEYSSRLAGDQTKLSTQFGEVSDVLREASFWARQAGHAQVTRADVERAIEEKIFRSNRVEERIQEMIARGDILVDVTGAVPGQINGLAVLSLGDYSFGRPTRITCETFMGREGVINIERRSRLSGNIHDKGVLILSGYVGARYAQDKPLSLAASLCFEQSYEMVEGDSASAAELIALLSSLAGVPLKQNIAITGSVNQKGQIQPIGGVNEKVEGFYYVCKAKGLTGDQGVIIPHQNVKNLMLRREVVEAIREGKFHIYPVATVDEAVEILTGMEAGEKDAHGQFPEGTFNYRVNERLRQLARELKELARAREEKEEQDGQ